MEYKVLDELVAIKNKGAAPKAKKALYKSEIVSLLKSEGLSKKAVYYLRMGFSFSGALPFAQYLQSLSKEERSLAISDFLSSEVFKSEDNNIAFRYAVSLLGYSVTWFSEDPVLLMEMIKVIPVKAYSKEKTILKDAPKIVDKYFLNMIKADTSLPELASLGLKDVFIRDFCKVLRDSLDLVKTESPQTREKILNWLGQREQEENVTDKSVKEPATELVEPSEDNGTTVAERSAARTEDIRSDKPFSRKELRDVVALMKLFASRMDVTVRTWEVFKNETESKQKQLEESNQSLSSVKRQLENVLSVNKSLVEDVTAANQVISDLRVQLSDAKTVIGQKELSNDTLQKELEKMRSVLSVYNADKQNSQSEQLNAIASKLKAEYRDFKDAENEEMTLDLGENFRFQLQSIFRILSKAGIVMEKK